MLRRTLAAACLALCACGDGTPDAVPDAAPPPPIPDAAPTFDAPPTAFDLTLRGTYPLAVAADLAAAPDLDLVAISEWFANAVTLVDVSDPSAPVEYARIDGLGYTADVQIKADRLYVNHEPIEAGEVSTAGIQIFDISDPTNPTPTGTVGEAAGHPGLVACHNTWLQPDRELMFCASTASGEVIVLSTGEGGVGTPDAPQFVAAIKSPGNECSVPHDMYARGTRLYIAWLCDGFAIYDTTVPSIPVRKATHVYADAFTHNVWPTGDDAYLLTSDEIPGGHLRVWDIRDLDAIEQVAEFVPQPQAIIHNVEVVGTTAFISHYTAGTYAVDISDPTRPVQLGADDFVDGPDMGPGESGMRGAWGVEPVPPMLYVSDTEGGLRIYELTPRQ